MDDTRDSAITPRQAAETLRRVSALAFQRRLAADQWHGAYLDHAARIYELGALLVEDATGDADVRRALDTLRLHEAAASAYLLRWLHITVSDFIEAALLGERVEPGGIPPASAQP